MPINQTNSQQTNGDLLKAWYDNLDRKGIKKMRKYILTRTHIDKWVIVWNWMTNRTKIPNIQLAVLTEITGIQFNKHTTNS